MELKSQDVRLFDVQLTYQTDYQFKNVASEHGNQAGDPYMSDEPDPVGNNSGPSTPALLGSAVGHCLSASLLEHMRFHGARTDEGCIVTDAEITVHKGDEGYPRIREINVTIRANDGGKLSSQNRASIERNFKKHCTVSASLSPAFPINVTVEWT
ncbi:OsmC family protein [Enterovibrio calviensis]|uniref:OsmC family protein n=1 Tax=Enterovibrio calviensis TaxID=91359 RepID=UPI00048726E2|nr:OsmC family protein [Enterovibrio calviensis]